MKNLKAIFILLFSLFSIIGLLSWRKYERQALSYSKQPEVLPITMCGSILTDWSDTTYGRAKILPGLGNLHYRITTSSPEAQNFFEQGLRLVYAFNHWEAIQAFREAVRLDPDCAMAYWGLALAYGPNLNDVNPTDREKTAFEFIQKALAKADKVTPAEQGLIKAMRARYNGKAYAVRDSLNRAYADAMIELSKKFPDDAEVLTLCGDAIMNTMPWDYWLKDGTPKEETQLAKLVLENALKKFPAHPGAHHLYIHLIEASSHPELALPSAKFLETAMPGAGHIVHMPAHIYLRVGNYSRTIDLNQRAATVDEQYLSNSTNNGLYRIMYYPHNVDFISYGSFMEGRGSLAIQTALKMAYKGGLIMNVSPGFGQYLTAEPMLAFVRFGKWNDILSLSEPDPKQLYTQLIWRFARGIAQLRTNHLKEAMLELSRLDSLSGLDTLKNMYFSFNPIADIAKVPVNLLRGEILMKQKNVSEAIKTFDQAVKAEDKLRYNEPPDWKIPSRHFLGAALFDAGDFGEAEKVFMEDLKKNPENGWSIKGLLQCQEKLGKKTEVMNTSKRFSKAWKNGDVQIVSSRF